MFVYTNRKTIRRVSILRKFFFFIKNRRIKPNLYISTMKNFIYVFRILSDNNSRKYNGTTYIETNDPHVQRINLLDIPQRNGTYEVEFSDVELKSTELFCKETKTIERKQTHN